MTGNGVGTLREAGLLCPILASVPAEDTGPQAEHVPQPCTGRARGERGTQGEGGALQHLGSRDTDVTVGEGGKGRNVLALAQEEAASRDDVPATSHGPWRHRTPVCRAAPRWWKHTRPPDEPRLLLSRTLESKGKEMVLEGSRLVSFTALVA